MSIQTGYYYHFPKSIKWIGLIISSIALIATFNPSLANNSNNEPVRLYHEAITALENNQHRRFNEIVSSMGEHPIAGYTQYQYLSGRISSEKTAVLKTFIDNYGYLKVSQDIRNELLKRAYKRNYWQDILKYYDAASAGTTEKCEYLTAILHQGNPSIDDQKLLLTIWERGKSQPDACDDAFAKAKKNIITTPHIWKRIENAVRKKNYKFAQYLGRTWLNQTNVDALIEARKDPQAYLNKKISNPKNTKGLMALTIALEYLAVDEPSRALKNYNVIRKKYGLTPSDMGYLVTRLCHRLSINHHQESLEVCDHVDNNFIQNYEIESEWRMRAAIRHQDWQRLLDYHGGLNSKLQQSTTWQYWRARALEQTANQQQAANIFESITNDRSIEGYLAADYLDKDYYLNSKPTAQRIAELGYSEMEQSNAPLEIVKALVAVDQPLAAKEQLAYSVHRIDEVSQLLLSQYAHKQGWHLQSILATSRAGYYDDLDIRFPLAHSDAIQRYAEERGLPSFWVAALIRQESIFTDDIRSSAGAVGLMQIMPATGRLIARQLGVKKPSSHDLTQPILNIKMGSWYIMDLWHDLGDRPRATAGYNAGPNRSRQWSKSISDLPVDCWIETIPFNETRNYVKRVMAYSTIYAHKLGYEDFNLSAFMAPTDEKSPLASVTTKSTLPSGDKAANIIANVQSTTAIKPKNKKESFTAQSTATDIKVPSVSTSVPAPLPRKLVKPFGVPLENERPSQKGKSPSNIIDY